jgi:tetratricopeptide (TPR) repeat protein
MGRRHAAVSVALARKEGDPYELAHALTMFGVALKAADGTLDAAIASLDEAVRVARAAGIDSALWVGLANLALWLPLEESQRAVDLLDEAIEVSTKIGDRQGISGAIAYRALLANRRHDWRAALRTGLDAAELKVELADLILVAPCPYAAGIALCALGQYEPAAVLIGRADASIPERVPID